MNRNGAPVMIPSVMGLTVNEAKLVLLHYGVIIRVTEVNGKEQGKTMDYRLERLNVGVEGEIDPSPGGYGPSIMNAKIVKIMGRG